MHTILLVDDELPLLSLLQGVLALPGERNVEVQEGLFALTADLMLLSAPSLILINPQMHGLAPAELTSLVADLKASGRARVVFHADLDASALDAVVQQHRADAGIPIRRLLADPLAHVAVAAPAVATAAVSTGQPASLENLAGDDILNIELDFEPARPVAPAPYAEGTKAAASDSLLALITAELQNVPAPSATPDRYTVALDSFSDHNLVGSGGGIGGVFVASVVLPRVGAATTLDVSFPWGETIHVSGTVEFTRSGGGVLGKRVKAGFSVKLTEPLTAHRHALERFADLRAPMAPVGRRAAG